MTTTTTEACERCRSTDRNLASALAAVRGSLVAPAHPDCCPPAEQSSCCDAADKAECCGAASGGSCGCR